MPRELQIQEKETEEENVIFAPLLVAVGAVATVVLWTTAGIFMLAGLAVLVAGIALWVFESIKQGPELIPPHPEYYHEGDRWHHPSTYWWGAVMYSALFLFGFFAMLRVAQAHGLLDPAQGDLAVRPWIGHMAAAIAAAGLVVALVSARLARQGRSIPGSLTILSLFVFAVAGSTVLQAVLIVEDPVVQDFAPRLASLFWMHVFESIWLTAGALAPLFVAPRAAKGHVRPHRLNVTSAVTLFAAIALAQYLLLWILVYLRLLRISADLVPS